MNTATEKVLANMLDVMVDLETADVGPDAAILAIGAVAFDRGTGQLGPTFYTTIDLASAVAAGGQIEASTFIWWLKQSDQARAAVTGGDQLGITEALDNLTIWLHEQCAPLDDIRLWGNGADFDPVVLVSAYKRLGLRAPWKFWNTRCLRTLRAEHPAIKFDREGTQHHALDDAISQAKHVFKIDASRYCPLHASAEVEK